MTINVFIIVITITDNYATTQNNVIFLFFWYFKSKKHVITIITIRKKTYLPHYHETEVD